MTEFVADVWLGIRRLYLVARYRWPREAGHAWRNVFSYKPIRLTDLDYEQYWSADASAFENDLRHITFENLIDSESTVADIGCGDGELLARLLTRRQARVHGFDISEDAVAKARAKGVAADVWNASTDDFPGTFDYIIIADCLEHIAVPERLMARVRGRFRKALLISIPNSCYWRYRARVMFGSFMVQWVVHPGEHLRFWSKRDMFWWLEQIGFRVEQTHPTWGIPLLKHLWPSMFAQNIVYVIQDDRNPAV